MQKKERDKNTRAKQSLSLSFWLFGEMTFSCTSLRLATYRKGTMCKIWGIYIYTYISMYLVQPYNTACNSKLKRI